jgi:hypothetical protein
MIKKSEKMCKEAVVAEFEVLSRNVHGRTEESHENPQLG